MTPTRDDTASTGARQALHICLVVHARYPIGEPRAERAALAARRAGHHVSVIALRASGEKPRETVEGVEVRRLPVSHRRGASIAWMLYEYASFALLAAIAVAQLHRHARIDVVEVHSPPDFLVLAGLVPRLLGSRLVLDNRDLSAHMWGVRFSGKRGASLMNRLLLVIERAACALADEVITVHDPYRDELMAHGVPPQKITVVMNTPDERLIGRVRGQVRDGRSGPFTVAYHGTITWWYGVDLIVEAIAKATDTVPDIRGLVLGEGDDLEKVRRRAQELGVDDRIELTGRYRPLEETLRTVARADCGVISNRPSELSNFILSNKLFEYIALGIPVVVPELPTFRAHFDPSEVTFFSAGDAESLAQAIRWVAENRGEARAKAARASERAQDYAWAKNSARYLALLHS